MKSDKLKEDIVKTAGNLKETVKDQADAVKAKAGHAEKSFIKMKDKTVNAAKEAQDAVQGAQKKAGKIAHEIKEGLQHVADDVSTATGKITKEIKR